MVVILVKKITGVFLLFAIVFSCAADTQESNLIGDRTFDLALHKFELALSNFEEKIDECHNKKIIVPSSLFESIDLTKQELKIALFVLSNKAEDACDESATGKFLIALSIYKTTAKHYGKAAELALPYSEDLLFGHYWGQLEAEAKYLNISKDQREILESIPELQQPFHPFKTLSKSGVR